MALRCLLVSLVASLGFELPSGQDVTSWTMSGRGWVAARMVDLATLQAETRVWLGGTEPTVQQTAAMVGTPNVAPRTEVAANSVTPATPAELVFESINEAMADDMNRDRIMMTAAATTATPPSEAPLVASTVADPTPVVDAEPDSVSNPELDSMTLAMADPSTAGADEDAEPTDAMTSDSASRLNSAVRLTCEAVQAWASVVQSVNGDVAATH